VTICGARGKSSIVGGSDVRTLQWMLEARERGQSRTEGIGLHAGKPGRVKTLYIADFLSRRRGRESYSRKKREESLPGAKILEARKKVKLELSKGTIFWKNNTGALATRRGGEIRGEKEKNQ